MLGCWHSFLYAATRAAAPSIIIETGVLYGHSSAAILSAMNQNRRGLLLSVDLPPEQHRSVIAGRKHIQVGLGSEPAFGRVCNTIFSTFEMEAATR
jgi:hypothetical protein